MIDSVPQIIESCLLSQSRAGVDKPIRLATSLNRLLHTYYSNSVVDAVGDVEVALSVDCTTVGTL